MAETKPVRLIDANAFARWLDENHYVDKPTGKCDERQNRVLGIVISAVKNPEICPTVDAVPVAHGQWLGEGDGYADGYPVMDVWYCSECNHCIDDGTDNPEHLPNYCPNCGAKMDAKDMDVPTSERGVDPHVHQGTGSDL